MAGLKFVQTQILPNMFAQRSDFDDAPLFRRTCWPRNRPDPVRASKAGFAAKTSAGKTQHRPKPSVGPVCGRNSGSSNLGPAIDDPHSRPTEMPLTCPPQKSLVSEEKSETRARMCELRERSTAAHGGSRGRRRCPRHPWSPTPRASSTASAPTSPTSRRSSGPCGTRPSGTLCRGTGLRDTAPVPVPAPPALLRAAPALGRARAKLLGQTRGDVCARGPLRRTRAELRHEWATDIYMYIHIWRPSSRTKGRIRLRLGISRVRPGVQRTWPSSTNSGPASTNT